MSHGFAAFSKTELSAALKAAREIGLVINQIEITKQGTGATILLRQQDGEKIKTVTGQKAR